jgi:hypothetical protein
MPSLIGSKVIEIREKKSTHSIQVADYSMVFNKALSNFAMTGLKALKLK